MNKDQADREMADVRRVLERNLRANLQLYISQMALMLAGDKPVSLDDYKALSDQIAQNVKLAEDYINECKRVVSTREKVNP